MTIKELISQLEQFPEDMEVYTCDYFEQTHWLKVPLIRTFKAYFSAGGVCGVQKRKKHTRKEIVFIEPTPPDWILACREFRAKVNAETEST